MPRSGGKSMKAQLLLISSLCISTLAFQQNIPIQTNGPNSLSTTFKTTTTVPPGGTNNIHSNQQRHVLSKRNRLNHNGTPLQMTNPLISTFQAVGSPLGSLAILAFVVLIHEAGHFLAARSFGISVKEFSVGVGPKVAGFQRKVPAEDGTKEEEVIDFNLRLIPLGGYVQFPENYNQTLAMMPAQGQVEVTQEEKEESEKSLGESIQKLFQFGKEEEKEPMEAPKQEKQGTWWNNMPISQNEEKTPVSDQTQSKAIEIEYYDDPNLLQNRPWTQRAVVLIGGVVFNLILAFGCYFGELTVGQGLPRPVIESGAVVKAEPRTDGASYNILQKGDIIVGVNGEKLTLAKSYSAPAAQDSITDFISTIRKTPPGDSLSLSVLKSGSDKTSPPIEVSISPRQTIDEFGNIGPPTIGVVLVPNFLKMEMIHATSIPDAFVKAGGAVTQVTTDTASSIYGLIGSVIKGETKPGQGVSGPVGVIRMGSEVVSTSDVNNVIAFAAAISINLAVVNSLPFPGLDGGQLVFVLSEAITARKVDQRLQEEINGFALLLLLMVSLGTTVGDVGDLMRR